MDSQFLARNGCVLLSLLLFGSAACASLEEVLPGCGNHVVEDAEDCDGVGKYLCGALDTQHQCRFVWEQSPDECPPSYIASPDKRCRKGAGDFAYSATFETPGVDPQVADFGADGTLELGMRDFYGLSLYSVNGSTAEFLATLPTFGVVAMGELSGDEATDIVYGTQPLSGASCSQQSEPEEAQAGLSVLRSQGDAFNLKVYANSTYGEAVRFAAMPSWLFGGCELFDLEVLTRIAVIDDTLEICAIDDCAATTATLTDFAPESTLTLSLDSNDAYVVASAQGQPALLYISREGFISASESFESPTLLALAAGATVAGGVQLADVNGDEVDDVVVIASDNVDPQNPYWLYVLLGRAPAADETFASLGQPGDVLLPWLPLLGWLPADEGASTFEAGQFNHDEMPDFFLGDRVLLSTGMIAPDAATQPLETYYRAECWLAGQAPSTDGSCPAIGGKTGVNGSAPGAVGDVNGDGLDDVAGLSLDVFDAPAIQVLLGGDLLPLVRVHLPSESLGEGELGKVAVSDFDGDGAGDILGAFLPTQDGAVVMPEDPCDAAQTLIISYGQVGGHPQPPTAVAQVPAVRQIASGRFRQPADGFGDFAVAITCGSSATLFGDAYRRMSSPFLLENEETFFPVQLLIRQVLANENDLLDTDDSPIPHADLIVVGGNALSDDGSAEGSVLLLPSWRDAELDLERGQLLELPNRWANAEAASTGRSALGLEAGDNLVAMAGIVYYDEAQVGLELLDGDWAILAIPDSGVPEPAIALPFPEPLALELTVSDFPGPPFAKIAMAKLNDDDVLDFAVVYGTFVTRLDTPVGQEGGPDSSPAAVSRVVSAVVLALSEGDSYVTAVAPLDVEDDRAVDAVVLDGKLVIVGQQYLYRLDAASGTAQAFAALGLEAFVTEALAGEFSGDGLLDLLVFDGLRSYLFAQVPLNP